MNHKTGIEGGVIKSGKMAKQPADPDYTFTIVLTGDAGTGKSALFTKFVYDSFSDTYNRANIGFDFSIKNLETSDNKKAKLRIWVTSGNERDKKITTAYYRDAHTILLVFDLTNQKSFINLGNYLETIKDKIKSKDVPTIILVGTKSDLSESRVVSQNEIDQFLADHSEVQFYYETSAKSGSNVDTVFQDVANVLTEKAEKKVDGRCVARI